MKKIFTVLLIGFSMLAFAQNQLKDARNTQPLYLIDGVIANEIMMRSLPPEKIESVNVYRSKTTPCPLPEFESFLKSGIIDIKMKKFQEQFTKVPLHALNAMYKLTEGTPVYVNGFLVNNSNTEIFSNAISQILVTGNDSGKVLNIILCGKVKERRIIPAQSSPSKNQRPGYIKQIQ